MRSVSKTGSVNGFSSGTPQIPAGVSSAGLSMKRTSCELGDQKGCVQQPPVVNWMACGNAVGVGVAVGVAVAVGSGVAVGVGDGSGVAVGAKVGASVAA